ncbi:MAG: diaminopimelate epimerase [Betaproteobacteria bacterium]|nr:diaminopimelate epimerase [Betaproteobacteria bacterium]
MQLKFTKMHGLGNDFVVIDAISQNVSLTPAQFKFIADRHFGIGCDQILLVERATRADADFRYRIFNADGGEVEQCGNGARCFVRFVHEKGLTPKTAIRVETASGIIEPQLEPNGQVTVNMGLPRFEPKDIPFVAPQRAPTYLLDLSEGTVEVSVLSMGNPHAVKLVADADGAPVAEEGPQIEHHPSFPARVNAGFMQVLDRSHIKLRVYERGAGETLACGTGACAAVAAGIMRGLLDGEVRVSTRGGELTVRWQGEGQPVWMTGPAVTVFEGQINL